jgi:hypothetical protein
MEKSTCKWRLDPGQIEVVDEAPRQDSAPKTPAERIDEMAAAAPPHGPQVGHGASTATTPGLD